MLPEESVKGKPLEQTPLAHLAARQHWMDRFVLPALAVLFTLSILLIARQYMAILAPAVKMPGWLIPAGAILALESVYIAGFHQRLRTPVSLRVMEFGLMLLPVYAGLWLGGNRHSRPFLSLDSFRDPHLALPLSLAVFAWAFARGYGGVFAGLGDIARDVGDQGAATFAWETEAYISDYGVSQARSRAVDYFTRRMLFYALLTCLFDALVVEAFPERIGAAAGWQGATSFGVVLMLMSGLLLQACVYLYRLHSIWRKVGISVQGSISGQWLWASLVFTCLVIILAVILPSGLSPFSFTGTMETMSRWLEAGFRMPTPQQGAQQPALAPPIRTGLPRAGDASWVAAVLYLALMLVQTLSVLGVALALIGLIIIGFLQEEWQRLPAVLKLPVYAYLWVKETARQLLAILSAGAAGGRELLGRLQRAGSRLQWPADEERRAFPRRPSPAVPALYIRHLFVLLMEAAGEQGLGPKADHTPLEYADALAGRLGTGQGDLQEFTQYYLKARYSREELSQDVVPLVDSLWQGIMAAIDAWRTGEEETPDSSVGEEEPGASDRTSSEDGGEVREEKGGGQEHGRE